jgi:hypothetical protein
MRVWLIRFLIGIVLFFNVQCAIAFWLEPQLYAPAYELFGDAGIAAIQGFGVLFIMWNVPYIVALLNPVKNHVSLWEAVVMQAVGVIGEAFILRSLPAGHMVLLGSISRFIVFDGLGLILLLVAANLCRSPGRRKA